MQAMDNLLTEFRASEACEDPLWHSGLERAHHLEKTVGGQQAYGHTEISIELRMRGGFKQLFNYYDTNKYL